MSSLRCLHRTVVLCREFGLLHLSRTKRRNWKKGKKPESAPLDSVSRGS